MKKMRFWTKEEREQILADAAKTSVLEAAKKHGCPPGNIYSWRSVAKPKSSKPKPAAVKSFVIPQVEVAASSKLPAEYVVVCRTSNLSDVLRTLSNV